MLKKKNEILFLAIAVIFLLLSPLFVFGAESNGLVSCSLGECALCHLLVTIERIFFWLLAAAFAVGILYVVASGYAYLFSAGKSKYLHRAKERLKYVLAGFAVCLLAWLVVHAIFITLGYKGSWWKMECLIEADSSEGEKLTESEPYINEVTANNVGGRNNPVTLPDLAVTGIKNLPANKYFFLHGLSGQPLPSAAKQLAKIIEVAEKEGKIIYAVTPVKNQKTFEIEGSQPINLTSQIGPNTKQTEKNIGTVLAGLIADSPAGTNFPFFVADSADKLTEFNNIWPNGVSADKSLKTYHNGVVYQEGESLKEADEETLFSVNLVSDNPRDNKNEKFYLNRDNPVTFNLPSDISPTAAKQMAVDIAQVVAESTKNSQMMEKDQWVQMVNLMSKSKTCPSSVSPDQSLRQDTYGMNSGGDPDMCINGGDLVYSPAAFASYAVKNPQTVDLQKVKAMEKELDKIAKDIIDKEVPRNRNNNILPAGQASNQVLDNAFLDGGKETKDKGIFETIQDYFLYPFSNTPVLDNLISGEKNLPRNGGAIPDSINVSRIPNLDPGQLSKIGGRITTDNMLSLAQREAVRDLIIDVQKEIKDNIGIDYNIPVDLIMCIFNKESKFDPGAMSQTGCSGLGQLSMGAARSATKKLKKVAPKHFKALSEKVLKFFEVNMEETLTREGGNDKKREILRSDPNLNAVLSYIHLTEKGIVGRGGTAKNDQELKSMVIGYGPGQAAYAYSIMECLKNKNWRNIPEKIQAIINARAFNSNKE